MIIIYREAVGDGTLLETLNDFFFQSLFFSSLLYIFLLSVVPIGYVWIDPVINLPYMT